MKTCSLVPKNLSILIAACAAISPLAQADPYRVDIRQENGKWATYQAGVKKSEYLNLHYAVQLAHTHLTTARTSSQKGMVVVSGAGATTNIYGTGTTDLRDVTNVIYDFTYFRVKPQASGACIKATRCHNMELRNFMATNENGWGFLLHFVDSQNVTINNLDLLGISGPFGVRMDGTSSTAPMTNPRFYGTINIKGTGAGRHGIETMHVKDFYMGTTITARDMGGCAILFNHTNGGYIQAMDVLNYGIGSPYAAFRLANQTTGNVRLTYFKATNGNRGLTTLESTSQNLTVDRFEITQTGFFYNTDNTVFGGSGEGIRLIDGTKTVLGGWNRRSWVKGSAAAGLAVYGGAGAVELINTEISGSPNGLGILLESGCQTTLRSCLSTNNGNGSRNRAGSNTVVENSSIDWR